MIPFLKKHISGNESIFVQELLNSKEIESSKKYSTLCTKLIKERYGINNIFLTSSSTAALELISVLINCNEQDEIIIPSYTYVSTATAFTLRGSKLRYADSNSYHPNISVESIRSNINENTKAVVPVHYGGISCEMQSISELCNESGIVVIEDAAHALDSAYKNKALGSIAPFGIISFHDTKNIYAGKGGALIINDSKYLERAEVIFENGTNRNEFYRKNADRYEWTDQGSSFGISELNAAVLYAQLLDIDTVQDRRKKLWNQYFESLKILGKNIVNYFPEEDIRQNHHLFYLTLESLSERDRFILHMLENKIDTRFHFQALHLSKYGSRYAEKELCNAEKFHNGLVRLPIYPELTQNDQDKIIESVLDFFK